MSRVIIYGAGRVGLANATYLADKNHNVQVVDPNISLVRKLKSGIDPYGSQYLKRIILGGLSSRVKISDTYEPSTSDEYILICFGSNSRDSYENLINIMLNHLKNDSTIIIRSTLRPQTILDIVNSINSGMNITSDQEFPNVWLFPEFLTEGQEELGIIKEGMNFFGSFNLHEPKWPDRELLELFGTPNNPNPNLNAYQAAIIKASVNIALAFKVTLANVLEDNFGGWNEANSSIKFKELMRLVERDPRIGSNYLRPGIGYGGNCLPFAMEMLKDPVSDVIKEYNANRPQSIIDRLFFNPPPTKTKILVVGYNFKKVRDYRNSNQLATIKLLDSMENVEVLVTDDHYDPIVAKWWVADPIEIFDSLDNMIIFYDTDNFRKAELYFEKNPAEKSEWDGIYKIDFR